MVDQPVAHLVAGSGPAETPPLLPLMEEDHSGKTAQAIVPGELHVLAMVHLDLGEAHGPAQLVDDPLQVRRQGVARGAPIGPEVRQYRALGRRGDDIILKAIKVNGEDVGILAVAVGHGRRHTRCETDADITKPQGSSKKRAWNRQQPSTCAGSPRMAYHRTQGTLRVLLQSAGGRSADRA